MVVFGSSFLTRITYDFLWQPSFTRKSKYNEMMYDLFMAIPFDLIPIMLILCFHTKNLMAYKREFGESVSD